MEKYITATEANQNLSSVLRDVASGTTYTVTSRGRAVANIGPPDVKRKKKDITKFHDFLKSFPIVHAGPWKREDLYD
ncbi:MAG: hypothetical protein RL367_157 [Pseudomonadota bacterium]|jgi:prevent-host-death family protein